MQPRAAAVQNLAVAATVDANLLAVGKPRYQVS
jgi:hypothetical protein